VPKPAIIRLADLPQNRPTPFEVTPDSAALAGLARDLDLLGLRRVRLSGQIAAIGQTDWRLSAQLGATVVQPCGVTLDPVRSRIDAPVERLYLADYADPDTDETEMPEDDSAEPLPDTVDLHHLLAEALALNLPLYPRKADADLAQSAFTEPGRTALQDSDLRPFAGLAALRDRLAGKDEG